MVIQKEDRLGAVLRQDPSLVDVFKTLSPAFERLGGGDGRGVISRLVTVEQAAQMAGIDADELLRRLNARHHGEEPEPRPGKAPEAGAPAPEGERHRPPGLERIPRDRMIEVDVRDELRAGREPFSMIMAARRDAPEGGGFVVRAIFEPVPLYAVMGKQGFAHYTERLSDDDWKVWFYRASPDESSTAAPPSPNAETVVVEDADADAVTVLDVRGLEPPEPMVRTLAALETLPRGKTLLHINVRVPQFLLPQLEERGFTYEIREQAPDLVRVFIRRAPLGAGPQTEPEI